MTRNGHATWLEAVSVRYDDGKAAGQSAAVLLSGRRKVANGGCAGIVLSINGRPLVSNGGQPTVFCSLEAAERFLALARIDDYEFCENEADNASQFREHAQCLAVSRGGLCKCPACNRASGRTRAA